MARFREATLAPHIVPAARRLGLKGTDEEVSAEVLRMARLSALYDHPVMSDRYETWVFLLHEGVVVALARIPDEDDPDCPTETLSAGWGVKVLCEHCGADDAECSFCLSTGFNEFPLDEIETDTLLYEWVVNDYSE